MKRTTAIINFSTIIMLSSVLVVGNIVANKYGGAIRGDYYGVPGLRVGLSGYYGHSIGNSYPKNKNGVDAQYKGAVAIGAVDFTYMPTTG